jgi:hypothetical protein
LADERQIDPAVTERLRGEYEKHLAILGFDDGESADESALHHARQDTALRAAS